MKSWSKKLAAYVASCAVLIVSDALNVSPQVQEWLVDLTTVYLPTQGAIDLAKAIRGK